jgi:hypothetical protein
MMKRGSERILRKRGDLGEYAWLNRRAIQAFLELEEHKMSSRTGRSGEKMIDPLYVAFLVGYKMLLAPLIVYSTSTICALELLLG